MLDPIPSSPSSPDAERSAAFTSHLLQPIGVKAVYGLALRGDDLLAVDPFRGYLLKVDPKTGDAAILNPRHAAEFEQATGLAHWEGRVWIAKGHSIYVTALDEINPVPVITLPYTADGVAVWESTLYV